MYCHFIAIFLSLGCILLEQGVESRTSEELLITLPNGSKLIGRALRSHDGRPIKAHMSIPYAQPPLGDLRFRNPLSAKPWDGILDASKSSPACIQRDPFMRGSEITGIEDCLYLNVYAPYSHEGKISNLPVIVWYHGGAFIAGTGSNVLYAPDNLLDHDIILVTANYRLGSLGFLSSGQEDCTGNFGLKDQVEVLKWVKENIAVFGGNPNSVTIAGNSAGGASVAHLMASPLTKGLFHRAIAQSGVNLNVWAQPAHDGIAAKRALKLAEILGCKKSNDWKQIINCLRGVSATEITNALFDFYEWDTDPVVPFTPVVEPDLPGAFITKHPRDEDETHGLRIPLLTGLTTDEGSIKSAPIVNKPELLEDLSTDYAKILPITFYYDHRCEATQSEITKKIIDFYFDGEAPSAKKQQNITNLFSDGWFLGGFELYLRKRLTHPKSGQTYVYLFSHKGAASFSEIFGGGSESSYGVCHADELQYLFPLGQAFFHNSLPTKEDEEVRKTLTELWVNFARTGNPTPSSSKLPKWQSTSKFPLDYYRIGNLNEDKPFIAMETGLFDERARFWREIGAHLPSCVGKKDEL